MFLGADTAQLVRQAGSTRDGAERLDALLASVEGLALAVDWSGPDAEDFRARLREAVSRAISTTQLLRDLGTELTDHADEQDTASSDESGRLGVPGGPGAPGYPVPTDDPQDSSPPRPGPLDPALQKELDKLLAAALEDDFLKDLNGNSADLDALAERLSELTPEERAAWVASLSDDELASLQKSMAEDGEGWFGAGGNTDRSRRALLDEILRDAHPDDVERISEAFPSLHPDGRGGGDAAQGTYDVNPDGTISPTGEVVPEDASWRDVDQGSYGDCVSLATLGMMMKNDPGWAAEHVQDNGNGTVTVTLYDENGDPEPITMPKELPATDGHLNSAGDDLLTDDPNAPTWPAYVERALAIQMGGSYSDIEGHGSSEVGPRLTGLDVETIPPTDADTTFDAARNGDRIVIGTAVPPPGDEHPPGWVGGHGFWVEGVSTNAQGEEVLVCRNPWGAEAENMELTREQYEQWTSSAEIHHD